MAGFFGEFSLTGDEDEGSPLQSGVNWRQDGYHPEPQENRKISGSPPGENSPELIPL